MLNALTFDVEDYYHVSAFASVIRFDDWDRYESRVQESTFKILDLLDKHRTHATFFVLGWLAAKHPGLVKQIHRCGHEIASHGYNHQLLYNMTPREFRTDVTTSKKQLEDITGEHVLGYRAPSYSIVKTSLWALEILHEQGFIYDSSIFPIHHDTYGIPNLARFPHRLTIDADRGILEIPPSTVAVAGINLPIAGGGYLRIFPYPLIRSAIRHINQRDGYPAVIYLHPWELDPAQPRIRAPYLSRFRHYVNIRKTEHKLNSLLRDFRFAPIRQIFNLDKDSNGNHPSD